MSFKYRIGLDVGTNSLGWSVLELDSRDLPCRIEAAGARIFSDGRDVMSQATLKASRREARSARRLRDRFKQRQKFLINELQKAGLLPSDVQAMNGLKCLNPLELRAKALTGKLPPYHIGRALFHLNQRRGFKSNRKDRSKERTSGKVANSVRLLLEQMGLISSQLPQDDYKKLSKEEKKKARQEEIKNRKRALQQLSDDKTLTYGAFLWGRQQRGLSTRARPRAGDTDKLYEVYPQRELYEDEFAKIWTAQMRHYPNLMTDEVRQRIHQAIFTQRPLKPQKVGKCAYLPDEDRTFRAMPSFQRYRMYQEVNNLEWTTACGRCRLIDYSAARDAIINLLEKVKTKKGQVVWSRMKNVLKEMELVQGDFTFNYETPKREGLDGNLTSKLMQDEDCVGLEWYDWPLDKQDNFIAAILDDERDDAELRDHLMTEYGLSEFAADNCINAPLIEGTASLSLPAAKLLLQKMDRDLMIQPDAVQAVANENSSFVNPFTRARDGELLPKLPYYGEAFQDGRHIIPGSFDPEDKHDDLKFYGGVTNPTVHIALNQIRQVVNELIYRYGHPASISIELGRDLPAGQKQRKAIEKEQAENQKNRDRIKEKLREIGQIPSQENILRFQLWEELGKDPNDRCCPFSGTKIGITDLFNGNTEKEHLIPFSDSLDDSRANKVLCTRQANRDKENRTPFEAFGNSPGIYNWDEIFARAKQLPKPKQWRFQKDAREIWNKGHEDFTERHLNDTRYIGRLTREYLENICPFNKIDVVTGRLTYLLRRHWGLKKNRDDHRHHAVDAIVIGLTTRSMLQKVATAAGRAEDLNLDYLFEKNNNGKSPIDPWDGFRDEVMQTERQIIVSHKPRRKKLQPGTTDGQLHNDTAYGIVVGPNSREQYEVVVRQPIDKLKTRAKVSAIRAPFLRKKFLNVFDREGYKGIADLATSKKIRSLRCTETLKCIPIKSTSGNVYKVYKGDSNWGMEIYQYPEGHREASKWIGVLVSRFDANQPNFKPGESYKPHPAARLIMRLQINDCIEIDHNGQRQIMRVQLVSQGLSLAPLYEANVDSRDRAKNDPFNYIRKSANAIRHLNARKVHISPTGLVNYERRHRRSK